MNSQLLSFLSRRPEIYETGTSKFWDDAHISKSMLEAHLNPELDSATRKLDFVKRSADWIAEIADSKKRCRLLDLGCGPGIYANLFAQTGFDVTGMDLSPRSIAYAKDNTDSHITYLCQNYLDIEYEHAFDVVTMIYCDFGVLSDSDRKILLRKTHRALKDGGLFIFDVCAPSQYEGWEEKTTWSYDKSGFWSPEPYACLYSFYRYDDCRIYDQQFIILEENTLRCFNIWNHAFTPNELLCDLADVGFKDTQLFGSVAGDKYTDSSMSICAVAQK